MGLFRQRDVLYRITGKEAEQLQQMRQSVVTQDAIFWSIVKHIMQRESIEVTDRVRFDPDQLAFVKIAAPKKA